MFDNTKCIIAFCKNTFLKQILEEIDFFKKNLLQPKQHRKEKVHCAKQPNQYAGRITCSETFSSSQTNGELQVNCNSNIQSTYWSNIQSTYYLLEYLV